VDERVDLNSAPAEELQQLPGVGDVYAKKIVAGRPYKSVEGLKEAGLPEATIEKITPLVTVEKPEVVAKTPPRPGMVWVNNESKVFHKADSRWYGKTKEGQWMTEEEATKAGFRASKQ
jgi:hypothetical protein